MSKCFYSALFTDKNNPSDTIATFTRLDGWDYILFTNLDLTSDSWTIKKMEPPNKNFIISAKMIKWLSHKYLSDYDIVFWMDAYCKFDNSKESILNNSIKSLEKASIPLFIKKHPSRDCIYDEVEACVEYKKIDTDTYMNVKKFLSRHKVPKNYGLYETNLMMKLNMNKIVCKLCEEVIELIKSLTYRDQLVLTYVLFKNNIKTIEGLNPKLIICDFSKINHTYIKENPRRIAVCFFGLTRSLKYTLPSIKKNIYGPLKEDNIPYDVYLHTYTINTPYSNPRAGEKNILMNNNEYKLLKPDFVEVEDKDVISKKLDLQAYRKKGNPWGKEKEAIPGDFTSLDNHILYLWSQKQLVKMVLKSKKQYTHLTFCRPDVLYKVPLQIKWFSFLSKSVYIPNFGLHYNINDRFALGNLEQMIHYGSRFDDALDYSKHHTLNSEGFLAATMKKYSIKYDYINFYFVRVRANGNKNTFDQWQIQRLTRRKKPLKKGTRKHHKFYVELSPL